MTDFITDFIRFCAIAVAFVLLLGSDFFGSVILVVLAVATMAIFSTDKYGKGN